MKQDDIIREIDRLSKKLALNNAYGPITLPLSVYDTFSKGYPKTSVALKKLMPKYQFSRAKWYEVHLMFKSYDPIQERLDWCEQTFGPQPTRADAWCRWYTRHTTLRFRDEKDYQWFALRWGA